MAPEAQDKIKVCVGPSTSLNRCQREDRKGVGRGSRIEGLPGVTLVTQGKRGTLLCVLTLFYFKK